jgi:hypothetical protein
LNGALNSRWLEGVDNKAFGDCEQGLEIMDTRGMYIMIYWPVYIG